MENTNFRVAPRPTPWVRWLALAALFYVSIAYVVFSIRHPWMTEAENFLHFVDAVTWSTVSYEEARPRG